MLARKIHHLCDLCFGDFVGIDSAFADSVMMHMEHDFGRGLGILVKEFL